MKVKDMIKMEIDVDVYDNVCEELAVAFCGGDVRLTDEGKREFADVLEYDVDLDLDNYVAVVDIDRGDWRKRLSRAQALFYSLAGFCSSTDYDRWFTDDEPEPTAPAVRFVIQKLVHKTPSQRVWVDESINDNPEQVYSSLAKDMVAKKLHKCGYIQSIRERSNYDGTRDVTVTYDNGVRRVYTIEM